MDIPIVSHRILFPCEIKIQDHLYTLSTVPADAISDDSIIGMLRGKVAASNPDLGETPMEN